MEAETIKRLEEKEIKNLQDIKEEVAKEYGFNDWQTMTYRLFSTERREAADEVTKRHTKEAVKKFANQLIDDSYHVTNEDGETVRVIQVEDIEGRLIILP